MFRSQLPCMALGLALVLGVMAASQAASSKKGVSLNDLKAKKKPVARGRTAAPPRKQPSPSSVTKSPPPSPTKVEPKSVWLVSRLGGGDSKTISDAVRRAPLGSRIVVRGGVYSETVALTRPVEISLEQFDQAVVLEGSSGPALLMLTEDATVRGLTLRASPAYTAKNGYVVDVPGGKLLLEDCEIGSGGKGGVWIHGEKAAPYLRKCRLRAQAGDGVLFSDKAGGTLADCDIAESDGVGIRVTTGAAPTVQTSTVRKCAGGVTVNSAGKGIFTQCEIVENRGAGLSSSQGGVPTFQGCNFRANLGNGAAITDGGQAILEGCKFRSNGPTSIDVTGQSTLVMRGGEIRESAHDGLRFTNGSSGQIDEVNITKCHWSAIRSDTGSNPVIRKTTCVDNDSFAIGVMKDGKATVEDCAFSGSVHWPVVGVTGGGELTMRRTRIFGGLHEGVSFWIKGKGTLEDCEIFDNRFVGILVRSGAAPNIRRCKIFGNKLEGVVFSEKGLGVIEECDIYRNGKKNLDIQTQANPVVRACRVQ